MAKKKSPAVTPIVPAPPAEGSLHVPAELLADTIPANDLRLQVGDYVQFFDEETQSTITGQITAGANESGEMEVIAEGTAYCVPEGNLFLADAPSKETSATLDIQKEKKPHQTFTPKAPNGSAKPESIRSRMQKRAKDRHERRLAKAAKGA